MPASARHRPRQKRKDLGGWEGRPANYRARTNVEPPSTVHRSASTLFTPIPTHQAGPLGRPRNTSPLPSIPQLAFSQFHLPHLVPKLNFSQTALDRRLRNVFPYQKNSVVVLQCLIPDSAKRKKTKVSSFPLSPLLPRIIDVAEP